MKKSVDIPITVKCRIGVDDMDEDTYLDKFIREVSFSGCETFIIHARKAWLNGLSPKDNREIPPLNYQRVYKLKDTFPELNIVINGGIKTIKDSIQHLEFVDGVMLGREAYDNPLILAEVDQVLFEEKNNPLNRSEILSKLMPYLQSEYNNGTKISHITKHLMGMFKGIQGAKEIRKFLVSLNQDSDPVSNFEFFMQKVAI
jgi:tRNA-dihydrouridine synthase A